MLERKQRKNRTDITFVLPADSPPGPVSVVGDFNDWDPHAHPLHVREDHTRAVTVALPLESSHSFRYLAAGDYWFNDESADGWAGANSLVNT
ncbi:isoamylase early set domain-containing protein [Streptomyces sp. NBC_01353]|uniref:isoamylase early set domain-containing protein n=1 Tax=Streptomyces sp. NBC_01353 TaxID=2903835 RepID=UPI002E34F27E|nr:isoamylase early set domain-containing protein [Streptomyces sp. NBC_01353]